jgi:hypothetical protein
MSAAAAFVLITYLTIGAAVAVWQMDEDQEKQVTMAMVPILLVGWAPLAIALALAWAFFEIKRLLAKRGKR